MSHTVLVCGGRHYGALPDHYHLTDAAGKAISQRIADEQRTRLRAALDTLHADVPITRIVHGAAKGADSLAHEWACDRGIPVTAVPAQWAKYGKSAGFIRNRDMLVKHHPDTVVAFPGGVGTAGMVTLAHGAGVVVRDQWLATVPPRAPV